jgi:hypothetical protein
MGTLIYHGFAPKTADKYFTSYLQQNFNERINSLDRGSELQFNSKFESGNLDAATKVPNFIKQDCKHLIQFIYKC